MLTENSDAALILVVEDEDNHTELIKRSFMNDPDEYRLKIVNTICDAKRVTEQLVPSLVLTDYRLPDGDGSELLLMAAGSWPVIIMTSHGNEQIAVEAMKIGAQDYIVKSPAAIESLPRTIKYALLNWELIVARRITAERVRRGKRDWERTFDAVPDLIAIIDHNHTIKRVNKAMAYRCGATPAELVGKRCCEVVHGLKQPPFLCPVADMMLGGLMHTVEIEEKGLKGIFEITVSPLDDEEGQITSYVHIMRDISSHKLAENALRESEEKHRKLANEQRLILNTSSVGICFREDRKVLWANPAFDTMFGYDVGSTTCLDTTELYADRESYEYIGERYSAIESGVIYSQDVQMKKKDGSMIWCNLLGQAVTPGNREGSSIWIIMDITERKNAEEERQKLEQQFQQTQKLESLGVLAGGIAHDFNNILSIIQGHCYILSEDIDSGLDQKAHIRQIVKATERAADLCRQMLSYAGKNAQVQTRINLWLLVDENVKMLGSAIKKNVGLVLDLKHDVPEIIGDSAQIQQIVMNLIINAAEAIGDKKGAVKIVLKKMSVSSDQTNVDFLGNTIPPGSYACLEVTDNGCGMDVQTQKRIFEPFFTTKFSGRGLGMSAVLGIIKSHDGLLQLSSTPGVGTTFRVFLPLPAIPDGFKAKSHDAPAPLLKGSGTILLVDDEEALRIIGCALLKAMGYSAIAATNGLEALEIFRAPGSGIDLIILDMLMPEMGGIEAYRLLRESSPSIPIVICSGFSIEDIGKDIADDQHVAVIQKPFKPDQLRYILMKLLEQAM